jgi:isopentenyl phosphate kinase
MDRSLPTIVLKIGGSVLTDRGLERPAVRREVLRSIAQEIASAWQAGGFRLVVVHGAGSFGHPIVKRTGIDRGIRTASDRLAFAETQRLQTVLNGIVVAALVRAGLPAFPFQASANVVLEAGRIRSFALAPVLELLKWGMVPVLNGVPAADTAQGCSILSGDVLAGYLATTLSAQVVLHGTNVRGVFTDDPARNPRARFLPELDLWDPAALPNGVGGSAATDVTGGMRKKLEEIARTGVPCQVYDATVKGNTRRALLGEVVGTIVRRG